MRELKASLASSSVLISATAIPIRPQGIPFPITESKGLTCMDAGCVL